MVSLSLMDPYTPAARDKLKLFVAASEQLRTCC